MKVYRCKFCKRMGDRKEIRRCIMTHIKNNKAHYPQEHRDGIRKSNITENMESFDI